MKKLIIILMVVAAIPFGLNAQKTSDGNETLVEITTSYGNMTIMLYNDTPLHRDNFLKLIREGWYEGSYFHRVIKDFMIQGGHSKKGEVTPGYTVPAEFNTKHIHKKGALAAARTNNPQKASSGCQFYIVQGKKASAVQLAQLSAKSGVTYTDEQKAIYAAQGGTPFLDMQYTVFGEVIMGMEVIDKIAAVQTGQGDKPVKDVTMSIKISD